MRFKGRYRRQVYNSDDEDDEQLLFSSKDNGYTANGSPSQDVIGVNPDARKKTWRPLPVGKPEPLLLDEQPSCYAVFPAGIYLRVASNPNPCEMLLTFSLPHMKQSTPGVVVPSMGAVYDIEILRSPDPGAPRSQRWCEMFGIITEDNLKKGIVEDKPGVGYVVWKKFRHKLEMLTPFALFAESRTDSSPSPYMILTHEEFDELLELSRGVLSRDLKVRVEPLFEKMKHLDLKPVHLEILSPAVVSNTVPDTTDPDSYVISTGVLQTVSDNRPNPEHFHKPEEDDNNLLYSVGLEEQDVLENLAQFAIESKPPLINATSFA